MQHTHLYIGHFTDNIDKEIDGTAFGCVIDNGMNKTVITSVSDGTYMEASFDGLLSLFTQVAKNAAHAAAVYDNALNVTIHIGESNVYKRVSKIASIYADVSSFDTDVSFLIDRKLLKTNRQKTSTHDVQKKLVCKMLEINRYCPLTIHVAHEKRTCADVRNAFQLAEHALREAHAQAAAPSNVVAFSR